MINVLRLNILLKFYMLCFYLSIYLSEALPLNACKVSINRQPWGTTYDPISKNNVSVELYTLDNCRNTRVQIISYGASIASIFTPDILGRLEDIVLGFHDIKGYQSPRNAFLGATLGRVANRIGYGKFNISNIQYNLTKNEGENTIHGGPFSFGNVFWNDCSNNVTTSLTLCHESPDGEGGFPGTVRAKVKYTLNSENELRIQFEATTNKATPMNMANHAYFNLAGHNAGSVELYEHVVQINANKYTPVDSKSLPTGEIKNVQGTRYDLRNWTPLGLAIALNISSGFDHNYVLSCRENNPSKIPCLAARIFHPGSKRVLWVSTNQPGMQFYTSNSLNVTGKENTYYGKHSAFCMETQHFPDSVNHLNFPNTIIKPNAIYTYETIYKFDIAKF